MFSVHGVMMDLANSVRSKRVLAMEMLQFVMEEVCSNLYSVKSDADDVV